LQRIGTLVGPPNLLTEKKMAGTKGSGQV